MHRFKSICKTTAAVLLFAAAESVQADTASLRYAGNVAEVAAGNQKVLAAHVYINGVDNYAYIGSYALQIEGQPGSFSAYCVDPFQDTNSNYQPYERAPLIATHLPPDNGLRFSAVLKLFGNAYAGSLANPTTAAGFQLALWEVWHDNGQLATGSIQSLGDSDHNKEAERLLGLMPSWSSGLAYDLTHYFNADYQDYSVATLALEVPEPGSYALLLAGLGMIGFARRRRSRGA